MLAVRCFVFLLVTVLVGCGSGASPNAGSPNTSPTNSPGLAGIDPTPSTDAAREPSTVTIDSPDGVKLAGSFFHAAKGNSPGLLLLHQWQSDRHSFDDFAKRMQAMGFAVLSIDGRGFGESTKKADGAMVTAGRTDADVKAMLGDVDAAFQFLSKQPNVDPKRVGILGASYGSSLAVIYAADHPSVRIAALLSPGLNYFGNMPIEAAVKKFSGKPLLLVAGEDDKESADSVRKIGSANNITDLIYPSGGHGTALFDVPATDSRHPILAIALGIFFDETLIGGKTIYRK